MKIKVIIFFLFPIFTYANMQTSYIDAKVNQQDPSKDATRSARTCHDLNGFFVTGDFLYWKAMQDGLEFSGALDFNFAPGTTTINLKSYEIDFEYKPGFRIGLGGDLPFNGWDVYLNWTRFRSNIATTKVSDQRNLVLLEGDFDGSNFFGSQVSAKWRFSYNCLDLDWGRRLFLDSSLIVRPSFGIQTLWMHHKIEKRMEDVESFNPVGVGIPAQPEFIKLDHDIWGIGPCISFYGKWNWIYGLGLAGQASGSIIWYDIDSKARVNENQIQNQTVSINDIILSHHNAHRVRPTAQLFLGLDWEWCFIPKRLSVQLALGYEIQYFWSMIIDPFHSAGESLPISLEGLTFKARLDF